MKSSVEREQILNTLNFYEFDVLVIGGGITGAGIALDAVTRGMSVALIEMQDFAAGTSSRSTKLIHGGLRYLKQMEIKMVAEVGKEREIVYENAVHVSKPTGMLLPFHKQGTFGPLSTSAGLKLYDYLAGVKKEERRLMLSAKETLEREPLVKSKDLLGGGYYVEYVTDDARLTIEVVKKAIEKGAVCLNYAKARSFLYNDENKVVGAEIVDMVTNKRIAIHAKKVVNATGPWVDGVRALDAIENKKKLRLTKGIHVVIDQSIFPLRQAIYFDTPDKRMVFAIPRDGKTYVGTTDTFFEGKIQNPVATLEDVEYLIDAIHYMFPDVRVGVEHVESTWAGVRPLIYEDGKDPSEISRKDEIWQSEAGLLTIAGGKLTGYRKMAETIVDKISKQLGDEKYGPCVTKHLNLSGGETGGSEQFEGFVTVKEQIAPSYGLSREEGRRLAKLYGSNVDKVFQYAHILSTVPSNLPLGLLAQVYYAVHEEMAYSPVDFLVRRTGMLYFHIDQYKMYKDEVLNVMKQLLQYSKEETESYSQQLEEALLDAMFSEGSVVE
ncbi:glycerol-3-phosphate dehydrogenase/oxidase [Psychrobacillus sp. FSL K6-2684]|uniref:Glycerol-3-phosphate dehydrogenase n=1 Tax=Psychrobacillus faecigallinarum TaxID=2762235 RepID=A0ABR8RF69_9BACI|nr:MULTISPECIES: glycerol-3-phosphate dehydrogenase/oxidase [Psychrobacillus]MBD7946340.1 glycerol-3-phosphate dehydrogenase/oxidase [Psychrobacillus faecigallinarum]QEY19978.1 glycerol-3-phosphate dehydrogenase/oxidase [Psychrobacillus sp. AK 1817]